MRRAGFTPVGGISLRATKHSRSRTHTPGEFAWAIRRRLLLFFLIALQGVAWAQENRPQQPGPSAQDAIRVNVDLVVLHATVQKRNALVPGLQRADFQVYEDGVLQQISSFSNQDIPVTVGLVVDNSGSMGPKRAEVIAAALAFARSSNPKDELFVINFNEHVRWGLPPDKPFTDKAGELRMAFSGFKADGMTALYDATVGALEHLKNGKWEKKVLIVLSDGADNASQHKLDQLMAMAAQSDATIYTVALFEEGDPDGNAGVLKKIARATGGQAFRPWSIKAVTSICEQIAHNIRNQYTIGYVSTNTKKDGTYRAVQVKASATGRGGLAVRTRAGYSAPLQPESSPAASKLP